MSGPAQRMRDELWARGWSLVEEWVREKQPETMHLEFKPLIECTKDGNLDENVSEALARAVSGFANTDGGLLVFGVDLDRKTRKNKGLDRAGGVRPYKHFERTLARITAEHFKFGEPWPRCVLKAFRPDDGSDRGVVALYVPKSVAPVRVSAASGHKLQGRFYLRNEHGFGEVPYTMLAAMFGARPAPLLGATLVLTEEADGPSLQLIIENRGSGTARDVFVRLRHCYDDGRPVEIGRISRDWRNVFRSPDSIPSPTLKEKALTHTLVRHLYPRDRALVAVLDRHRGTRVRGGVFAADCPPVTEIDLEVPKEVGTTTSTFDHPAADEEQDS